MDADGEDDPHALPTLLDREEEVVFAQRGKRHEGWRFQLGYQLYRALFRAVTGQRMRVGPHAVIRKTCSTGMLSDSGFAHFGAAPLELDRDQGLCDGSPSSRELRVSPA